MRLRPARPAPAAQRRPTPVDARDFDALHDELSYPTRRRIMWILATDGRTNVGSLCRQLRISKSRISSHLHLLKLIGLIFHERQGQRVYYEINPRLVRLDHKDGRFLLTVSQPSGAGVTMFGPESESAAEKTPAEPARVGGADAVD